MITLLLVLFGGLTSTLIGASFPQEREKALTNGSFENSPLEIVSVTKNGQKLGIAQKFSGNDDWLKGLEIILENKFSKTITFVVITIGVPDTTGRVANIRTTIATIGSPTTAKDTKPNFYLLPGGRHTIQIDEKSYERLYKRLTERGMRIPDQAEIRIEYVMFDDDTMWRFGSMHQRNPQDPDKWDVIPMQSSDNRSI